MSNGWMPFKDAPRDGSKFDVWYEDNPAFLPTPAHRLTDVYWSDLEEEFCTDGIYGPKEPLPINLYPRPTHWRPLPEPPSPA